MVLASTGEDLSIDNLAVMADKIMEVAAPTVSSVSTPPPPPNPEVAQLREEVAESRQGHQCSRGVSISMQNREDNTSTQPLRSTTSVTH